VKVKVESVGALDGGEQSGDAMNAYTRAAANPSATTPTGIALIEVSGDLARYNKWVGLNTVPVRWVPAEAPGIVSVTIDTATGTPIKLQAADLFASAL
jgi:hypothetical protein